MSGNLRRVLRQSWLGGGVLLLALGAGHAVASPPSSLPEPSASSSPFTLVGLYDPTALAVLAGAPPSTWVWTASPGLEAGCGEAKAPVGMGLFEAQALADRVSPALIVVLRRDQPGPPPGPDTLRLAIGEGAPEVLLAPAVLPRNLRVEIDRIGAPDAGDTLLQLVRTQLEMELCLEHKVGRAWTGGRSADVREAFLLDPPSVSPDRMYFGGQGAPVPALLGPPAACLGGAPPRPTPTRGARAVGLVPSDVWGASLPACVDGARGAPSWLPVRGTDGSQIVASDAATRLGVTVRGAGRADATVEVQLGGSVVFDGPLFVPTGARAERVEGEPGDPADAVSDEPESAGAAPAEVEPVGGEGMVDLLATLPQVYPELIGADGAGYTVLVVPGWQLGEALDRLEPGPDAKQAGASGRPGVAEILADPSRLWVQARQGDGWLDVGAALGRSRLDPWAWGHPAGRVGARSPAFLLGIDPAELSVPAGEDDEDPVDVAAVAQRAGWQASTLAAVVVVLGALGAGLGRLRDLWTVMPEERIDYWPGEAPEKADEADGPDPRSLVEEP